MYLVTDARADVKKFARVYQIKNLEKVVHVPVPTNNAFSMELVEKLRYAGDKGPKGEFK